MIVRCTRIKQNRPTPSQRPTCQPDALATGTERITSDTTGFMVD